ncbi:MAG: VTT domain-containing protein [Crocinitomicaceae bacterium]
MNHFLYFSRIVLKLKKIIYYCWLSLVIAVLLLFIIKPSYFTPGFIAGFLADYSSGLLGIYFLASLLRGLFLIPSTPFVLAGAILFPEHPALVITISMIGILFGATAIYYFSDSLGFSKKLETKYPKQLKKWHDRLNSPRASLIVIAWSFFPLVPTDLICYVAGIVRMRFLYLIAGVFIGEMVLVYCYVVLGAGLFEYILG